MNVTQNIIKDIEGLRGATVRIFGQPSTLPAAVGDFEIDIIEILKALYEYEINLSDYATYDNNDNEISLFDYIRNTYCACEVDADLIIDELENNGYLSTHGSKCDNSYNWCAPIANHFDFEIYKDLCGDGVYVRFMVHRFGDVRCNYTDAAIYHFDNDYEFLNILSEQSKEVDVDVDGKTYHITIDVLQDGFEVFDGDYNYVCTIYCVDNAAEAAEEIKEKI